MNSDDLGMKLERLSSHTNKNSSKNTNNNGNIERDREEEEREPKQAPPPRFQSPNKMRMDGALSASRNQPQSHGSPFISQGRKHVGELKWKQPNNTYGCALGSGSGTGSVPGPGTGIGAGTAVSDRFERTEKPFVRRISSQPKENDELEQGQIENDTITRKDNVPKPLVKIP